MNRHLLSAFTVLCATLLVAFAPLPLSAEETELTTPDAVLKVMLKGVISGDIDQFTYKSEPELKARVTQSAMTRLSGTLGSKLKLGYTTTPLGQLRQQGMITYLYKIELKTGNEDILVRLSIRDGLVAAVFFE